MPRPRPARRPVVIATALAAVVAAATFGVLAATGHHHGHPHTAPVPASVAAAGLAPAAATLVLTMDIHTHGAWATVADLTPHGEGLAGYHPSAAVTAVGYAALAPTRTTATTIGERVWLTTGTPAQAVHEAALVRVALRHAGAQSMVTTAGVSVWIDAPGATPATAPLSAVPAFAAATRTPSPALTRGVLWVRPLAWLDAFGTVGGVLPAWAQTYLSTLSGGPDRVWVAGAAAGGGTAGGGTAGGSAWTGTWAGGTYLSPATAQKAQLPLYRPDTHVCPRNVCVSFGQLTPTDAEKVNLTGDVQTGAVKSAAPGGPAALQLSVYPPSVVSDLRGMSSWTAPSRLTADVAADHSLTVTIARS